ncbi:hypothetical protein C8Q74DRAFT_324979 [Fomes fomentarius]|nr:hypothetical protein C8Q74DRAFT_324979 [Fomes fomentarius]
MHGSMPLRIRYIPYPLLTSSSKHPYAPFRCCSIRIIIEVHLSSIPFYTMCHPLYTVHTSPQYVKSTHLYCLSVLLLPMCILSVSQTTICQSDLDESEDEVHQACCDLRRPPTWNSGRDNIYRFETLIINCLRVRHMQIATHSQTQAVDTTRNDLQGSGTYLEPPGHRSSTYGRHSTYSNVPADGQRTAQRHLQLFSSRAMHHVQR